MDEPLGRILKRTEVSKSDQIYVAQVVFIDMRNKKIVKESFEVSLYRKPSALSDDFSGYYTMPADNYTECYRQSYFCGCFVS